MRDWKTFYAGELADPRGRAVVDAALRRHAGGDAEMASAFAAGGIASFPHVSIHDAAEPIARVVGTILERAMRRVVALGVLHGGTLPERHRAVQRAMHESSPEGMRAFRQLGGAFVALGPVETPFGTIAAGPSPSLGPLLREADDDILSGEFSLDLFLALLAAGSRARGVPPPAVTRVFVSATRDPSGAFDAARAIARALDEIVGDGTACVATGDIVHIGHGYSAPADAARLPADADVLAAALVPPVRAMHDAALARHDFATAFAIGTQLMSDQRHILPVIAERLGPGARCVPLQFRLADYSAINAQPAPCFVAAALTVFVPATAG